MAQKQFTNFQDDILSFDLREAMLGVLKPGRYCGYDTATHNTTGGGIINVFISHAGSGIQKANKTLPTPALSNKTGVFITTQGGIIHDDTTTIAIAIDQSASTGDRYDIIYGEHTFLDGTPGPNPATYSIKKGTAGAGTPTLNTPSKQTPLILVRIPNTVVTFAGLIFTPYKNELGDLTILDTLSTMLGTLNGYSEQNYITNNQSVTASLNSLDMILKDKSDLIAGLIGTKLDDWGTPDDNTDLNATSGRHGLLPKLSNIPTEFLNGQGGWAKPVGSSIIWRTSMPAGGDFDMTSLSLMWNANKTGDIDLSGLVPVGTTLVFLQVDVQLGGSGDYLCFIAFNRYGENAGNGPNVWGRTIGGANLELSSSIPVGVASQKISYSWVAPMANFLSDVRIKVLAWQVPS